MLVKRMSAISAVMDMLQFCAEGQIAGIAEARYDVRLCCHLLIDRTDPETRTCGKMQSGVIDALRARDGAGHMYGAWFSDPRQRPVAPHYAPPRGQHGIDQHEHTIVQRRTREVFHLDLESILAFAVFAVGAHESALGAIETIEHSLVQRQTGAKDRCQDR